MAVHRTGESLQRAMSAKARELRVRVVEQTPSNAATYIQAVAVTLAPIDTGETVSNITKNKVGTGHYQVISQVRPKGRTGFMQNFWANRTPPFRAVRMIGWPRNRGKKEGDVSPTVYGDQTHLITGMPGFFYRASHLGQKRFRDLAISNVQRALRVSE